MTSVSDRHTHTSERAEKRSLRIPAMISLAIAAVLIATVLFAVFIDRVIGRYLLDDARHLALDAATSTARIVQLMPGPFPELEGQDKATGTIPSLLQKEIADLAKTYGNRLTIIDDEGLVVADSGMTRSQLETAQNHKSRPEILEARENGHGFSIRHSATLNVDFLYAASLHYKHTTPFVVRAALPLKGLVEQTSHIRMLLVFGVTGSILMVAVVAILLGRLLLGSIRAERAHLEEKVSERTATLRSLQELGSLLSVTKNVREAGEVLCAGLPALLPAQAGALALINNSRDLMIIEQEWGSFWKKGDFVPPDACWALRKNAVHHSVQENLPCAHLAKHQEHNVVCIPLLAQGEVLGVIHLKEAEQRPFSPMELEVAKAIGKETAIAISNLKLRETLEQQALHDPLTGLYNRRYLEERFESLVAQSKRDSLPFWILVIDVDHFKNYNDQHGHDAGDFVLIQLAKLLKRKASKANIACRLGGEEFAVVLPGYGHEEAAALAEDIRSETEGLSMMFEGRHLGCVTISGGLSTYPSDGEQLANLLKVADEHLYLAKRSGRNRICCSQTAATSSITVTEMHARYDAV
ncbi:diguanylate cyclase [Roseibium sp.]|uniref:GGDEF domain-containing protein n=1 Tax=Roseibium sp. TaxID=1936156 RepID=UPI003A96D0AF